MKKANQEIRQEIRNAGLSLWQIGKALWNINEVSTVRRFRYELTENEKRAIREIIEQIKEQG